MMETLPRISLLQQAGYRLDDFDWFYVNADLPFQRISLASAGVPSDRVVDCRAHPHVRADRLVVPSPLRDVAEASNLSCDYLGDLFRPRTRGESSPSRVYISRRQISRRRILSEDELDEIAQLRERLAPEYKMLERVRAGRKVPDGDMPTHSA
jgi:capsular polysaccharide biosynthesis protein